MAVPDPIFYFLLALGYSFLGSIPPAPGNLITIQLSISRGLKAALLFVLGEIILELIFGYIAWIISIYIADKTKYDLPLNIIAVPIFLALGIYFFLNKKTVKRKTELKSNKNFSYGLLIGLLNPLAIPFWVVNISYFFSNGWLKKESPDLWFFIMGIPIGSFLLLFFYAFLAKKIDSIFKFRIEFLNRTIGAVFILMGVLQLILLL
jgi:threonine/homoserine/homoserine lactone efflux protein